MAVGGSAVCGMRLCTVVLDGKAVGCIFGIMLCRKDCRKALQKITKAVGMMSTDARNRASICAETHSQE
jgi:hypothetical protein